MTESTNQSAPAADLRLAALADLQSFLQHDEVGPATIGEAADANNYFGRQAQRLIDVAGGTAAVEQLHDRPHNDRGFNWSGIDSHDRSRIDELLRLISSAVPVPRSDGEPSVFEVVGLDEMRSRLPWCQPEYRTIAWRILRTLALEPQRPLHRRNKPERLAAAIMWVALTASGGLAHSKRVKARTLWDWFDVSSCKAIGRDLADHIRRSNASANNADEIDLREDAYALGEITLGDSALLHSAFRLTLLQYRDELLDQIERSEKEARDSHPIIVDALQGHVGLRSRPVTVRWAMRGEADDTGRACVSVVLGESADEIEVLGLSVPDARRLIEALHLALDGPIAA